MSHTLNTQTVALLAALKAIVTECMDYPPVPRYSHDSYLPAHLLADAQAALALVAPVQRPQANGVLLSAPQKLTCEFFTVGGSPAMEIYGEGFRQTFYNDSSMSRQVATGWSSARWVGYEVRTDAQGRQWNCEAGIYITDDFGILVLLEGGAA